MEIHLTVSSDLPSDHIKSTFTSALSSAGLDCKELCLKKYPGSTHWHITKPGEKGTLEATWRPSKRQFWFSIHSNRRSDWQEGTIQTLGALLDPNFRSN